MAAQGSPSFTDPLHFELRQQGNSSYKLLGCGQLQASCILLLRCWELVSRKQILDLRQMLTIKLFLVRWGRVVWLEIPGCLDMYWLRTADWCWLLRSARPGVRTRPRGGSLASPKSQSDPILKSSKLLNSLFQDFFDALCIFVLRRLGWLENAERERESFAEAEPRLELLSACCPLELHMVGCYRWTARRSAGEKWIETSCGDVWHASDFLFVLERRLPHLYQGVLARWAGQVTNGLAEGFFYTLLPPLQRKIQQR